MKKIKRDDLWEVDQRIFIGMSNGMDSFYAFPLGKSAKKKEKLICLLCLLINYARYRINDSSDLAPLPPMHYASLSHAIKTPQDASPSSFSSNISD